MATFKNLATIIIPAFVIGLVIVLPGQAFNEEDYSNVELPGLALPSQLDDVKNEVDADPKPCCFPKVWQGNMTLQAGVAMRRGARLMDHLGILFVDENNKKIAGRGPNPHRCCHNTTGDGGFVMLFGANNTADFYAFNMAKQKCYHKKLDHAEFRNQCIPPNATYRGSFSLGPTSGGLKVQSWSFRGKVGADRRGPMVFVAGKIMVVPSGCIPVMFQDHGMIRSRRRPHGNEIIFDQDTDNDEDRRRPHPGPGRGMEFVESAYFSNIQTSIKDPSVFTPPSYCKNATSTDELKFDDDNDYQAILEKFISY